MKTYKLGEVCELSKGKTITRATTREGQVPVIGGGLGPTYFHDIDNRKPPVITISASGANAGFVNYWDLPIWASDCTTIVEKPGSPALIGYIYKYLQSRQDFINNELRRGSAQPHVYPSDIANLEIQLPSIEKQQKIVEKLDSIFSQISLSVSTTNESLERLVSCFDSFLNGILQEQITICGEKKLVDVVDIARGGSPRPIEAFLTEAEDGINWIKISDATSSNKYITETVQKIKPEGASRSRVVHPGDFLLSNSMSFGRPYIMGTSGCIHDGWLVLSNTKGLLNQDYLYYVLGSKYIYEQFNRTAAGSTVRNLNISLAGQVKFPVPSLDSQKSIVSSLVIFEASINEMQESLRKKITKLAELKDALLAEAFEVDIQSSGLAS
jgi:restriction endonuclease S subunit